MKYVSFCRKKAYNWGCQFSKFTGMDERFKVKVIGKTDNPQTIVWYSLHQCHTDGLASEDDPPDETECGRRVVKLLLNHHHYGPLEHPQIVFNVGGFPHSVVQQATRHRLASFDVQSGRFCGENVRRAANGEIPIEEAFYYRPTGIYTKPRGGTFEVTEDAIALEKERDLAAARHYRDMMAAGFPEEVARDCLPGYRLRQNFVVSFNLRSLLHFLSVRTPMDAQWEIRCLCKLFLLRLEEWAPEVAEWYLKNLHEKNKMAP